MKRTLATILVSVATTACSAQATDVAPPDAAPVAPTANTRMVPAPTHELQGYNPSQSLAPLVKALQPAVVNIQVKQKVAQRSMPMSPFFGGRMPQGETQYRVKTGQGSGFIISEDGYLRPHGDWSKSAHRTSEWCHCQS